MANGLSKYAEKYLDTQFEHLHEEIKKVQSDVNVIKLDMKKNGKCLHSIEKVMGVYKLKMRTLYILVGLILTIVLVGLISGIEFFSKGILGFL